MQTNFRLAPGRREGLCAPRANRRIEHRGGIETPHVPILRVPARGFHTALIGRASVAFEQHKPHFAFVVHRLKAWFFSQFIGMAPYWKSRAKS